MKVAIDKTTIKKIKDFDEFDYVYIFDDEPLQELLKLGLHCVNKDFCNGVDINLTPYNINSLKKANISDKDWKQPIKKKDYKFAIIVPNYNNDHGEYQGKTFLRNCIESILSQTYKNFELIIVDDMSTDSSVETIEEYKSKEEYIDKIHLLKNKRKRYNGGSRNVGIEYAFDYLDFDYFCFLDSDDWWKHDKVLENINNRLYNHEMLTLACEMIGKNGIMYTSKNKPTCYEDLYSINNNLWCTAWARVIRKDKIVYFCEDTTMEDRVWTYKLADNIEYDRVDTIDDVCYCWNRMNTTQSVSITRNDYWNASAWCHIGHQKQFISELKHTEMKPILEERIKKCINKVQSGTYEQY